MTREKIIEKFKENAEKIPNKWGEVCWVFIDENFEEIADELLALIEQEKKESVKDFVEWYKVHLNNLVEYEKDLYANAKNNKHEGNATFFAGEINMLQRLLGWIDTKLENFMEEK